MVHGLYGCIRSLARVLVLAVLVSPFPAAAQTAPSTFKVGFYNIQSGKGEPALTGRVTPFTDNSNCTDATQPLNAWGIGFVQQHLNASIGADPGVVALGLAEAWLCGSPENVRLALGWKARSSERNGTALVARYGFAGPEQWQQLDTSQNANPADTMWVLRVPVCLDAGCSQNVLVFVTHWLGSGLDPVAVYDRQAQATIDFMRATAGAAASMLIGDLNVWDSTVTVCGQPPMQGGLQKLRDAGYIDAWPLLHGSAEGFTGMLNRTNCGQPYGYAWKRIDYTWSLPGFLPSSIARFGVVPAGDAAPSDHYGLITEFPRPAGAAATDTVAPTATLVSPEDGLTISGGAVTITATATDDIGVTRVEILEDGVVAHTLLPGQTTVSCTTLGTKDGTHTVVAQAFDAAGNMGISGSRRVYVQTASGTPLPSAAGEIVLYAKNASVVAGNWTPVADSQAAGGVRLWNPDAAVAKMPAALSAPAHYFELTFNAEAGRAYRLWLRGRADLDYWGNDSVYVQFNGSVDAAGVPAYRIGTTGATWVSIEECSGCGLQAWGWQDNGYGTGVLGPLVYFAVTGPQTLRIQQREDGISLDQIVLSPALYLSVSPGAAKLDGLILPLTASAPAPAPTPASGSEVLITGASLARVAGAWKSIADSSAAGGLAFGTADAGAAKVTSPLAAPLDYVELTFTAEAGRSYRLWLRGRAEKDSWANDSVYVQFSGAIDTAARPTARIGTTEAATVNLEESSGAGLSGWGWQDNGYGAGVLGPLFTFAATGPQTMRIQTREDGLRIDQIVLSPGLYLQSAPGALKNDTTILH